MEVSVDTGVQFFNNGEGVSGDVPGSQSPSKHLSSLSPSWNSPGKAEGWRDTKPAVLVRVPTWRRVKNVKHVYKGESWNASVKPSHVSEPLSTEAFERHVKLAALEKDEDQRGQRPKTPAHSMRARQLQNEDGEAFVDVHALSPLAASTGGLQGGLVRRVTTSGGTPSHRRAKTPSQSLSKSGRPTSSAITTSPIHSLRHSASRQQWRPKSRAQRGRPMGKEVQVVTKVSVPTSVVPWSPVHRHPKGEWNKSKQANPRPMTTSNAAYVRRLGEAVLALPPATDRAARWRRQIPRRSAHPFA